MSERTMWTYKGVNVYPAEINGSGIAWYASTRDFVSRYDDSTPVTLRAGTKQDMRDLITYYLARAKGTR